MADEEHLEDGRRKVPLEPSSGVDQRVHLSDAQRETATRTLANGTVLTSYRDPPPTADEYAAARMPDDEYEALIEEVIAEHDAEKAEEEGRNPRHRQNHPQADWDPAPINRIGLWARKQREAEEAAKRSPEASPWEGLDDVR